MFSEFPPFRGRVGLPNIGFQAAEKPVSDKDLKYMRQDAGRSLSSTG
jgi:hypothetical protein